MRQKIKTGRKIRFGFLQFPPVSQADWNRREFWFNVSAKKSDVRKKNISELAKGLEVQIGRYRLLQIRSSVLGKFVGGF